MMSYLR